ncbi:hypothetical protein [Sphingomonas sp. RS2018]
MRVVDWIARTAMLVLASLATLALIGSLASVSDSALGDAVPGVVSRPDVGEAESGATALPTPASDVQPDAPPEGAATEMRRASPAPAAPTDDIARWLKALTYAVIALAAFAAAGVVALVRIAGHLDRATLR